jgi:TonB family protein
MNQFELTTHAFLVQAYENLDKSELATGHCLAIGRMTPTSEIQDYQPLVKISPQYPTAAHQAGREGYVTVEYEVDDFGFVRNPKVVDKKGPRSLAYAAIKAAEKFRYAPRFEDGKAVATEGVQNRFTFQLVD